MSSNILELREKRNALWEQTKDFLDKSRGEDGLVPASAMDQYDKMVADMQLYNRQISALEAQAEMDSFLSMPTAKAVTPSPVDALSKPVKATATEQYRSAFWNMIKGDYSFDVRNALSAGVGEDGGYTVPDEFEHQIVEGLDEVNVVRQFAHVIKTASGTTKIPVAGSTATASWIEEGDAIDTTDVKFAQATLGAYKLGAMVKVSNELLNDSAFDIGSYVARQIATQMGHKEEQAFIVGDGDGKPTGILADTGAELGATAAKEAKVAFDDVIKLYYSLKSAYRKNGIWVTSDEVMLQLMTLKDGSGAYIWKPSLDIGKPDTILGRPVYTTTYMPVPAAGEKVLAFGDFDYYWIADRGGRTLTRLNELYAENDQVGFRCTQRVDGKLVLSEAVKYLKMAGTLVTP